MLADAKCFCMRPSAGCLPTARCPELTRYMVSLQECQWQRRQCVGTQASTALAADSMQTLSGCCWGRVALLLLLLLQSFGLSWLQIRFLRWWTRSISVGWLHSRIAALPPYFRVLRSRVELGCSCSLTRRSTLFHTKVFCATLSALKVGLAWQASSSKNSYEAGVKSGRSPAEHSMRVCILLASACLPAQHDWIVSAFRAVLLAFPEPSSSTVLFSLDR